IAGYCFNSVNPSYRGMLWVNSGFSYPKYEPTSFMTQPGHWSQVYGINNSGTVVGNSTWFSNPTYHQEASVWFAGLSYPTLLPTLFDMNSLDNLAIAINRFDSVKQVGGDIVGNQKTQNGTVHASLWQRQPDGSYPSVWDLGSIGGATKNSYATAINEFNEVVGKSQGFAFTSYHAFRTTPFGDVDGTADMGTGMSDDSRSSEGNDINSLGEMVGASDFAANPNPISYAAYKAPGSPKDFGWHALGMLPQGTNSVAKGIGKLGLIVGASNGRAIVFSNAGDPGTQTPLDLNNYSYVDLGGGNLQLVTLNGWTLLSAEKINDSNCIVGSAYKAGQTKAFLLTPRP
ncbi:MAG TPA: hypothetical protein VI282_10925, partial [Verrucomicrobiae bacterium]